MKKSKASGVTASLILFLLGLFIAIRPDTTIVLVLRAVACALVFVGGLKLYSGLTTKERTVKQNMLLGGAGLLCIAGLVLFFIPSLLTNLFPQIIGLLIICLGIISMLNLLDAKDKGDKEWYKRAVFPAVSILGGALILVYSDFIIQTGIRLVGVFLMYQGGSQLFLESSKPDDKQKKES